MFLLGSTDRLEEVDVRVRLSGGSSGSASVRLMVPRISLAAPHDPPGATATVGAWFSATSSSSKEPMSQTAVESASPSWGLSTPRWSVSGGGQEVEGGPLSMFVKAATTAEINALSLHDASPVP